MVTFNPALEDAALRQNALNAPEPVDYREEARRAAQRHGVNPDSFVRQIGQESGFDPNIVNARSGAKGIAQFMPGTAADFGIDPSDPLASLDAAARYNADNLKRFGGNERAALAAYNWGPGNVQDAISKYGADWEQALPAETRDYLAKIHGGSVRPPGVDPSVHPTIQPPNVDTSVHPFGSLGDTPFASGQGLSSSDVPYPSGEDDPSVLQANSRSRLKAAAEGLGGGGLGGIKDFLTSDVPYADKAKSALASAYDFSVPGTKGILKPANVLLPLGELSGGINAVHGIAGLLGINTPTGGDVVSSQLPSTPLDIGLSLGPDKILKAFPAAAKILKAEPELARIVSKSGGFEESARLMEQAYKDAIAAGKGELEARAAARAALKDAGKVTAYGSSLENPTAATVAEASRSTDPATQAWYREYLNSERAKKTASQLSERMGPGVVGEAAESGAKAPDALSNEADVLDWALRNQPHEGSTIGDIATAAKRLGDPASEIRRQLQQNGPPDTVNAATGGDSFKDAARAERQAQIEATAREADQAAIAARSEILARQGGGAEATLQNARERTAAAADAAEQARIATEAGQTDVGLRQAAREAQRAEPQAERDAVAASQARVEAADLAKNREAWVQGLRERTAAAADAAEQARIAAESAQTDVGLRQAAREAQRAEPQAERDAVAASQARVEAADQAKNREAWVQGLRDKVRGESAPGVLPIDVNDAKQVLAYADRLKQARETARAAKGPGVMSEVGGLLGAPRALALSADLGTARDLTIIGSHPDAIAAAVQGGKEGAKAFISPEAAKAAQDAVKANPWHDFVTSKQNFERPFHVYEYGEGVPSDLRVPEMSGLNKSRISGAVENLPWVIASDRALAVQRNTAGMKMLAGRAEELAQKYGSDSPKFYSEMQSTIDWANHTRGYSGGGAAKALGGVNAFLSPQQLISRLQLVGDPISFALRGNTESAKYAAENLLGFAATQTAMLTLLKLSGGQVGGWSVNANPTSGDFGQLRVGNERFDTLAGLGPLIKLTARIGAAGSDEAFGTDYAKNQAEVGTLIQRWLENKENPTSKIISDAILHNKLPDENTAIGLIAPSLATGIMQSLQNERGSNKLLAIPSALANTGGVGTTAYQTSSDQSNQIAQDSFGKPYSDLQWNERLQVVDKLPDDARRAGRITEKQAFDQRRQDAGFEEVKPEMSSKEAEAINARNAERAKQHPDIDVQSWYWNSTPNAANKEPGSATVHTPEAANGALDLKLPDRQVKLAGLPVALNADPASEKLWREQGDKLGKVVEPPVDGLEQVVRADPATFGNKPFAELTPDLRQKARSEYKDAALRSDPSLEAANWHFQASEVKQGGSETAPSLKTPKAVDLVLADPASKGHEVKLLGLDRALNASPEVQRAWEANKGLVTGFLDGSEVVKFQDKFAQSEYRKPYAQLESYQQTQVNTKIRSQYREEHPATDAMLAWLGYGADDSRKRYGINSPQAEPLLEQIRSKYGRDPAKPGFTFYRSY